MSGSGVSPHWLTGSELSCGCGGIPGRVALSECSLWVRNECNRLLFSVSCTISVTWQRKETRRSVLLHTEGVLCDGLFNKCLICKIPSFPCQSSPLTVVLSAVVTSISRLSETGAHFQRRIWKIVQIFFPLCDLSAGPSWVSCSDFIQRFSYNRCTE